MLFLFLGAAAAVDDVFANTGEKTAFDAHIQSMVTTDRKGHLTSLLETFHVDWTSALFVANFNVRSPSDMALIQGIKARLDAKFADVNKEARALADANKAAGAAKQAAIDAANGIKTWIQDNVTATPQEKQKLHKACMEYAKLQSEREFIDREVIFLTTKHAADLGNQELVDMQSTLAEQDKLIAPAKQAVIDALPSTLRVGAGVSLFAGNELDDALEQLIIDDIDALTNRSDAKANEGAAAQTLEQKRKSFEDSRDALGEDTLALLNSIALAKALPIELIAGMSAIDARVQDFADQLSTIETANKASISAIETANKASISAIETANKASIDGMKHDQLTAVQELRLSIEKLSADVEKQAKSPVFPSLLSGGGTALGRLNAPVAGTTSVVAGGTAPAGGFPTSERKTDITTGGVPAVYTQMASARINEIRKKQAEAAAKATGK